MAYTTINKPTEHFNTKLYTGNGGTQTISGIGFQPDFTWVKSRNYAYYHYLQDAVRGSSNVLYTNNNDAEATGVTAGISAWNSDGYVTGSQGALNGNGKTFVAWNWKANGTGSANTVGSINSTVSANTTSGFSIVTFTGTGSAATVGHGLGAIPKMIIIKSLSGGTSDWIVYHNSIGNGKALKLNSTVSPSADAGYFNSTTPTSTVFSLGVDGFSNGSGQPMIAYCFANVQGFSKMGSYTGNGNADGPFCYNGFSPSFVMIKRSDMSSTGRWVLWDNKRNPSNLMDNALFPNDSAVENDGYWKIDGLSNGFKIKDPEVEINASGATFIYMAFAEAPLVGTNNIPANAR